MNILVLSPHRGSAAFSLALALTQWRAAKHPVTIINVFSRSLHAPWSDADTVHENDRLTYVTALRRKEDEAFQRQIPGLAMLDLNLKDAPIRLRCDPASVSEISVNPEDPAIVKIRKTLTALTEAKPSALVIPLAIGNHVDHRVVRHAAEPFADHLPAAFYEDLSAAVTSDPGPQAPLAPILIYGTHADPAEFKRRMAVLYASQIDGDQARAIADYSARYKGAERLWANPAWLSTFV